MKFLIKTEVEALTYAECQQQLRFLTSEYNLDKPLLQCWEEVWPVLNELTDMLLYLEDRISKFEDPRIASMDMSA
jgi:hypothetical protein